MKYFINQSAGDIIYAIPAIRKHSGDDKITVYCGLEETLYLALKPLMECNDIHLEHISWGIPKYVINLETFRYHPLVKQQHLCQTFADILGVRVDYKQGWLRQVISYNIDSLYHIINVTNRYRDKLFNWRKVIKNCDQTIIFLGHEEEYKSFIKEYPYFQGNFLQTNNLLDAADIIYGAKTFTGTQSALLAIAQGLGRDYSFERSPFYNNVTQNSDKETIINKNTHKVHFALSRLQQVYKNFII